MPRPRPRPIPRPMPRPPWPIPTPSSADALPASTCRACSSRSSRIRFRCCASHNSAHMCQATRTAHQRGTQAPQEAEPSPAAARTSRSFSSTSRLIWRSRAAFFLARSRSWQQGNSKGGGTCRQYSKPHPPRHGSSRHWCTRQVTHLHERLVVVRLAGVVLVNHVLVERITSGLRRRLHWRDAWAFHRLQCWRRQRLLCMHVHFVTDGANERKQQTARRARTFFTSCGGRNAVTVAALGRSAAALDGLDDAGAGLVPAAALAPAAAALAPAWRCQRITHGEAWATCSPAPHAGSHTLTHLAHSLATTGQRCGLEH